ncbi:hypothetical protein MA16_Dca010589 [Dendrobium catenatum]|uniref:AMP-activated protein kinase glycogen-binding domain-containing protein n=1 Tax=Dendrobium catenatum TaxID=906689 RepID=A0A2I0VZK8_9ASPA|nr:hypothetical protein MA16_Dca010589 [Dendrobium catenatum]
MVKMEYYCILPKSSLPFSLWSEPRSSRFQNDLPPNLPQNCKCTGIIYSMTSRARWCSPMTSFTASNSLNHGASSWSEDHLSNGNIVSEGASEKDLPQKLGTDELKSLLLDSERSKLLKKLSEANQYNRFLKRQLQIKDDVLVSLNNEVALLELESQPFHSKPHALENGSEWESSSHPPAEIFLVESLKHAESLKPVVSYPKKGSCKLWLSAGLLAAGEKVALVNLAEEVANSVVQPGSRKINGKYIQSHLLSRLQAVHERLKEKIKDANSLKFEEVTLVWIGMAESVQVMGSFDGWSQGEEMSPEYSGNYSRFSATLKLRPGRYEVKFLVDGEWLLSPELPTINFSFSLSSEKKSGYDMFYETFHGGNISIQYLISADVTRGYLHKALSATLELIVEHDKASLIQAPISPELTSFFITQDTQKHQLLPELSSGRFQVTGNISTHCSLSEPLSGELIVEASAVPIRSIDILLLRVESILTGERIISDTSVVQITQARIVADGDVCRSMTLPIYVMLPRLLVCPTVLNG